MTGSGGSGGTGSCPYTKDNVSWGEYQVTIPMPSGTGASYFTVIMEFDADTTIVSQSYFFSTFTCFKTLFVGKLSQQLFFVAGV